MALKDLRSRFDRHTIQDPAVPPAQLSGQTVAGPNGTGPTPSEGAYYSDNRTSDSPFDTVRGPKMDQMVQMLNNNVTSGNSGLTYGPAPGGTENSPFQDMNGNDFGAGFANPLTGNYMGQYINPDTGATYGG
jgi:hypothetical protein